MDANVNGTRLYYDHVGAGPTMLMMHGGLGLDHSLLCGHDVLADQLRLVYYDHRGHGRSAREDAGNFEISTLHDDACALLDHLDVERSVIYGHSYGVWLALGFALRYPERTAALVLCSGAAAFDYADTVLASAEERNPVVASQFREVLATTPTSDGEFQDMWPRILPLYFHRFESRYLEPFARIRYSAQAYATGARHLAALNMVDQLGAVKCPTVLIVGDDDFVTPTRQSQRIAAKAGDAEVAELPACGHFPFLEKPAEYYNALRSWIERRVAR